MQFHADKPHTAPATGQKVARKDKTMSNISIKKVMDLHSIFCWISNGRVYAIESYTLDGKGYEDTIDVTGWTKKQILDWLGY